MVAVSPNDVSRILLNKTSEQILDEHMAVNDGMTNSRTFCLIVRISKQSVTAHSHIIHIQNLIVEQPLGTRLEFMHGTARVTWCSSIFKEVLVISKTDLQSTIRFAFKLTSVKFRISKKHFCNDCYPFKN